MGIKLTVKLKERRRIRGVELKWGRVKNECALYCALIGLMGM